MKIKINCLNAETRGMWAKKFHNSTDAGLDIPMVGKPWQVVNGQIKFELGIKCEPDGAYMILPRSSLGKSKFRLANSIGLIDKDYRGELIALCDYKDIADVYFTNHGDRMFQMVAFDGKPIEWELVHELSETERGESGFGSTGR
ncbi:dUTP diphosphatase [candidate division WWE3 bacterium]|nr:dUTP diphosphatase [candidate division WWE3 bacterium]